MTYFLLKLPHYYRNVASVRADEMVARFGGDVATSPLRLATVLLCPLSVGSSGRLKSAVPAQDTGAMVGIIR
jgi:hypothetical protein